jgi:hypothetical protein
MSTKNADGTLMDLSGNSNHGDIYGAVRSGGYFTDGMNFDGVDDKINCGNSEDFNFYDTLHIFALINPISTNTSGYGRVILNQLDTFKFDFTPSNDYPRFTAFDIKDYVFQNSIVNNNKMALFELIFNASYGASLYKNGEFSETVEYQTTLNTSNNNLYVSSPISFDGHILFLYVSRTIPTESQIKSQFNSLATLPLYTFDASKYPTSSGWTSNVPYSSMSISSGEFSFTDAGQLQCDSAGSFTLRNAHQFDGDEYIKVVIDGVEYTGTGSVSQGNVTVAITQSSTKIDVDMGTSDLIDGIDIQFREPVE